MIPYDFTDFPFGTPGWAVGAPVLTISWDEGNIGFIKPILLAYYDLPINYYEEMPGEVFRFDDPDVKEKIEVNVEDLPGQREQDPEEVCEIEKFTASYQFSICKGGRAEQAR